MLINYILIVSFYSSLVGVFAMLMYKVHKAGQEFAEGEHHDVCTALRDAALHTVERIHRVAGICVKRARAYGKRAAGRVVKILHAKVSPHIREFIDDVNGKHDAAHTATARHGASFFLKEVKEHKESIKNDKKDEEGGGEENK